MNLFQIIEIDAGLTVMERQPDISPEAAAERVGGLLVDAGPYVSYDDAYEAMLLREDDDED